MCISVQRCCRRCRRCARWCCYFIPMGLIHLQQTYRHFNQLFYVIHICFGISIYSQIGTLINFTHTHTHTVSYTEFKRPKKRKKTGSLKSCTLLHFMSSFIPMFPFQGFLTVSRRHRRSHIFFYYNHRISNHHPFIELKGALYVSHSHCCCCHKIFFVRVCVTLT